MVDTVPDFEVAINAMRAGFGAPPISREQIKHFVGKGSEHLVRSCLEVDGAVSDVEGKLAPALESYQTHYAQVNGTLSHVYPGVREGLEKFASNGWRLACVTNKPERFATALLRMTALLPYFELVLGGDSVRNKKPAPDAFLDTCSHFGIASGELVVIGDSSNDAEAARAAGCVSIIVSYGYNHGSDVHRLDADAIVNSLVEAWAWIETVQSSRGRG